MLSHVSPAQFDDWIKRFEDTQAPLVLDVREPWEVAQSSVKAEGFELVNIPMGEILSRLQELDPDRPIACLCHHGARSMSVAQYLATHDFADVTNITGGIDAWTRERDASVPRY